MDTTDLNAIIDKLASKLSVTASELQPVAVQLISEYRTVHCIYAAACILGLAIFGVLLFSLYRWVKTEDAIRDHEDVNAVFLLYAGLVAGSIGTFTGAICHIADAASPTYGLLTQLVNK